MNYPNGNTVADVKKSVTSAASKIGANIKSEAKDLTSDLKSDIKSDLKSGAKNLKSQLESSEGVSEGVSQAVSDTKSAGKSAVEKVSSVSSTAGTVLSSALAFLPVKNADEAISMLQTTMKDVQSGIETARDSATSFVKKYPLYSLLGAAAIGAAAVLLLTRKSPDQSVRYDA